MLTRSDRQGTALPWLAPEQRFMFHDSLPNRPSRLFVRYETGDFPSQHALLFGGEPPAQVVPAQLGFAGSSQGRVADAQHLGRPECANLDHSSTELSRGDEE